MKKNDIRSGLLFLVLTVVVIWVLLPIFKPGFMVTDDGDWMVIRLSAFYQSLREGQFPVRFLGRLYFSYGYPVANFLYPGFLYLGSLIHVLGFNFVNSVKIILAVSMVGAGINIYYLLRKVFDRFSSLIGTTVFFLSPYLLFDVYKRGSVGEILAIFSGTLLLLAVERDLKFIVPTAAFLLVLSHNTLALLFFAVIFLKIIINKKMGLFFPALLGFLTAAFFWVPALAEEKYVVFNAVTVSNPFEYFAYGNNLYLLGIVTSLCLLVILFHKKITNKYPQLNYYIYLYLFIIFLATPVSAPLWLSVFLVRLVQFPYRFLALNLVSGSFLTAGLVNFYSGRKKLLLGAALIFFSILQSNLILSKVRNVYKEEGFYTTNEATTTVANEYMPKWVKNLKEKRPDGKIEFYVGHGFIDYHYVSTQKFDVTISTPEDSVIRINTVYYPGWGVTVNDQPAKIDYENSDGLIQIPLPAGVYRIKGEFRETPMRFAVDVLSLLFGIGGIYYTFAVIRKRR